MPTTFFLLTFGCKVNQYESQALREAWTRAGLRESTRPEDAKLICINSCAVTANGERDARKALAHIARVAPTACVILTGCAAQLLAQSCDLPASPYCIPQKQKHVLLDKRVLCALCAHKQALLPELAEPAPSFAITTFTRSRAVLKVQDGCSQRCTYCFVPSQRSVPVSRPPEAVVAEARTLLEHGFTELILSGINLRQYGIDKPAYGTFWDLVRVLEDTLAPAWAGKARFRISSLDPAQLDTQGLAVLRASSMLCPHLHISLQHTSPKILRRMGRGHYTAQACAHALEKITDFWPLCGLGCDIIAGFPGETADDHKELCTFSKSLPWTYAHVFPYSVRPGTPAAHLPDHVPEPVRTERAYELRTLFAQAKQAFYRTLCDRAPTLHVVFEPPHTDHDLIKGVCEYYVPCVLPTQNLPARATIAVRPKAVTEQGVLVERA